MKPKKWSDSDGRCYVPPQDVAMVDDTSGEILFVDDDDGFRETLRHLLEAEGYSVVAVRDGRTALRLLNAMQPSLIILDLMMPDISGWDLLQVRDRMESLGAVPVIVISASRAPAEMESIHFLKKPLHIDRLLELVATYCERRSASWSIARRKGRLLLH